MSASKINLRPVQPLHLGSAQSCEHGDRHEGQRVGLARVQQRDGLRACQDFRCASHDLGLRCPFCGVRGGVASGHGEVEKVVDHRAVIVAGLCRQFQTAKPVVDLCGGDGRGVLLAHVCRETVQPVAEVAQVPRARTVCFLRFQQLGDNIGDGAAFCRCL